MQVNDDIALLLQRQGGDSDSEPPEGSATSSGAVDGELPVVAVVGAAPLPVDEFPGASGDYDVTMTGDSELEPGTVTAHSLGQLEDIDGLYPNLNRRVDSVSDSDLETRRSTQARTASHISDESVQQHESMIQGTRNHNGPYDWDVPSLYQDNSKFFYSLLVLVFSCDITYHVTL